MSKFKQVLKEWQSKISEAARNVMRIEDDYGQFTFPPDVSNRVPADIEDAGTPTFYAIGNVEFTITDDSDYNRETGYGPAAKFDIDYVDVERIEYTDKSNNYKAIDARDLTEGELKFVEEVLSNIATKRYDNGDIDLN
jgi:hypothetical protein